ncbi:DUF4065 domain-containing protein [Paenibacillus larvae]|nr:type II toxin-antitoxin system antitoxin SocA domain-containing protein [Paenibacillus larvae]MDT2240776.1 DUF4065 domain-containing protein [Paenibacillus larvae]
MIQTEERAKQFRNQPSMMWQKHFFKLKSMTQKSCKSLSATMPTLYLAIYEKKLFDDNFEAWVHGPVNPQLYTEYREYGWQEIPQEINYPNSIMKNERV